MFLILPRRGEYPIPIIPDVMVATLRRTAGWIPNSIIRTWPAPRPDDEGISLLVDEIGKALQKEESDSKQGVEDGVKKKGRVGIPMGPETQLRMPLKDLFSLQQILIKNHGDEGQFEDVTDLIFTLRFKKSEAEIKKMKTVCTRVGNAFENFPKRVEKFYFHDRRSQQNGDNFVITERELRRLFQIELLEQGVDSCPYVIAKAGGPLGYSSITDGPDDVPLSQENCCVFGIDTGAKFDEYWSDFTCNWFVEFVEEDQLSRPPSNEVQKNWEKIKIAHEQLYRATEKAMELIKKTFSQYPPSPSSSSSNLPILRCCDIWQAMADSLQDDGVHLTSIGRMGHGLGLTLTERPSLAKWDHSVISPKMVITLEPSLEIPTLEGKSQEVPGILVHEENLVIREGIGFELLSKRCPYELEVIRLPKKAPFNSSPPQPLSVAPPPISFSSRPRVTLGFVQLGSDILLEVDAPPLLSQIPSALWRVQKMNFQGDNLISEDTYFQKVSCLPDTAEAFLPVRKQNGDESYGSLDYLAVACTSLSMIFGPQKVREKLKQGYPGLGDENYSDMATAMRVALQTISRKKKQKGEILRVGYISPYIDPMHQKMIEYLEKEVPCSIEHHHNFQLVSDDLSSSVSQQSIVETSHWLAQKAKAAAAGPSAEMDEEGIDVLYLGCSALNVTTFGFIDSLEKELGGRIPVLTSTQAFLWHCLCQCGKVKEEEIQNVKGYGCLFRL